jgi:uncharacterized Tic20 family protein
MGAPPPPPPAGSTGVPAYTAPTTGSSGYPGPYVGPTPTPDDKTMAMLSHLLGIVLGFVGPLIIWLIKKDQSPFVDDQGKESLNFQIMLVIGYVIGSVTSMICIGFLIIPAVWIFGIIFSIIAALKAKDGVAYRYPVNLRLIK